MKRYSYRCGKSGFTLMEALVALALVAILAAIAIPVYQNYVVNAEVADIELEYKSISEDLTSRYQETVVSKCEDLNLPDEGLVADGSARVSIGFQAVSAGPLAGYRPVLQVCAQTDRQPPSGLQVARAVHERYASTVEPGAVVLDSVVSFALPLTPGEDPVCIVPVGAKLSPCGEPVATPEMPVASTGAPPLSPRPGTQAVPEMLSASVPEPLAAIDESVETDFADPPVTSASNYEFVDPTVWGWHTDNPDGKVEHGVGAAYGDTSGTNLGIIELEGYANTPSNLYREIATTPGASYKFSFDLSGRTSVSSQSAGVEILWEGKVIDTIYPPGNTFGFIAHEYDLVATQEGSRIEMRAVTQDGSGPIVDNLKMEFTGF